MFLIRRTVMMWLLAAQAVTGHLDPPKDDDFDQDNDSEDEIWNAVVEYYDTYGGGGKLSVEGTNRNDIVFQEAVRVVKGWAPDPESRYNLHYNAVLISDRIATAICTVFTKCIDSNDYFWTEKVIRAETLDRYQVRRADEKRDISLVSCGIFDLCTPLYEVFALGLILHPGLPVPSHAFEVIDASEVKADWTLCRLHAYRRRKAKNGSNPDGRDFGIRDAKYVVFKFQPLDPDYNCSEPSSGGHNLCGSLLDPHGQFCSMLPGGIVMCNGNLLGVSQTYCDASNRLMYKNKTEFAIYLSTITKTQTEYWEFLQKKDEQEDERKGAARLQILAETFKNHLPDQNGEKLRKRFESLAQFPEKQK